MNLIQIIRCKLNPFEYKQPKSIHAFLFFSFQFRCGNSTDAKCINQSLVCDFVTDCDNGEDEIPCSKCLFVGGSLLSYERFAHFHLT